VIWIYQWGSGGRQTALAESVCAGAGICNSSRHLDRGCDANHDVLTRCWSSCDKPHEVRAGTTQTIYPPTKVSQCISGRVSLSRTLYQAELGNTYGSDVALQFCLEWNADKTRVDKGFVGLQSRPFIRIDLAGTESMEEAGSMEGGWIWS
jgi:hypothetical protein